MSCTTTAAVILCVFAHLSSCLSGDKVKLKEVQVLTLQQGQYTAGRRSHPVPQLNCRGGSAGCQDQPSVVQCYNRGTDGRDVQWECKAEMKRSQKFGLLRVTSEGYDSPQDEYVLVGSCGLEYYLERTANDGGPSHGTHGQHKHKGHHIQTTPTSALPSLWNAIFVVLPLLGSCALCFYCFSLRDGDADPLGRTSGHHQELPLSGAGCQPVKTQAAAERSAPPPRPYPYGNPPPPYNPHYVSASPQPAPNSWWAPTTQPRSSSGGPGFWTGAAAGGLLGYLLGNRDTDAGERHLFAAPVARAFQPASYFGNDSSSDGCSVIDVGDMLSDVVSDTGHSYYQRPNERCTIPQTLQGEWYSKESGDDTYTTIDNNRMSNRGDCLHLVNRNNDNFTIIFEYSACYYCVRIFVRTLNVLEKIETGCVNLNEGEIPDIKTVCRSLDVNQERITLFSTNPTAKNCRSSLEGVWKFAYQNTYKFTGECKHPDANITACQMPGTQFFVVNQQFTINYKKCEGMQETEEGEVQYKCLGDWYIGKDRYFAVMNTRESRIDAKYRCFLANRDDDIYLGVSIEPECSSLKTPQESPERYRLEQVKTEIVQPSCTLPDNFTGTWLNTANFDALVVINKTHIVETWKPDTGRIREQIYVCVEARENRYLMARHGIHGCQRDFVCFNFVPRHHSVIRYRKGKEMITDVFSTVCSWTMFPDKQQWRYDILISREPVSIKCPVAGKFRFDQTGDIPFETRIRGGVTQIPRPNVYCKENISDFSVCDKDQKIILIDADYCISVDYFGRPVDIYSEPDYELKCIAFWKENLRSYLITYNEEDAYSKYRCWVYQRADLNRILMSQSVGAFCHVLQDVTSNNYTEGAEVALDMVEYEREHDDCPMYFDDGSNPYQQIAEQAAVLMGSATGLTCHLSFVHLVLLACLHFLL